MKPEQLCTGKRYRLWNLHIPPSALLFLPTGFSPHSVRGIFSQGGHDGREIGVPRVGGRTQATGLDRLVKMLKNQVVLIGILPDGVCVTIVLGHVVTEIGGVFPGDDSGGGAIAYGDSPVAHKKCGVHGEFQRAEFKRSV